MAQTFIIKSAVKNSQGNTFRVVKDRSWDDMPFSFLVQKLCANYSAGRMVSTWRYTDKCTTADEALKIFERKTK